MEPQRTSNSQNNLEKEQNWYITLPDYKILYKSAVIKIVRCRPRDRHIDHGTE